MVNYGKLQNLAQSGNRAEFISEYHKGGGDMTQVGELYSQYRSGGKSDSKTSSTSRQSSAGGFGPPIGSYIDETVKTQIKSKPGNFGEFDSISKSFGLLFNEQGKFRTPLDILKQTAVTLKDEVLVHIAQQAYLLNEVNEKAGITGELSSAFREEIMKASVEAAGLGITFNELTDAVVTINKESGKFKLMSSDTMAEISLASKFTENLGVLASMGSQFERVGVGIRDMALMVEKMGLNSMTLGINARESTSLVHENLERLNQYGFQRGVEGLNRMAQKSIEFRMNMNSVFQMAEKVWEPDKALELVANLQVIGGAFGDLNDPIKLMYMATNNVEGLQDALIGAAKSLVVYNEEQGRFQITGANLRRAREMATELGVSLDELTSTAIASMERTSAATDLMSRGLVMKDDDKEFLTNLSQMKEGRMVIEVPQSLQESLKGSTEIALETMTQEQADLLLKQKNAFEKMTMEDVARQQVTAIENIERDLSYIRAATRVSVGEEVNNVIEKFIGINQKEISSESLRLRGIVTDTVKGGIKDIVNWSGLSDDNKNQTASPYPIQPANPPMREEREENTWKREPRVENINETKNLTVTLKSSGSETDVLYRHWVKSPHVIDELSNKLTSGSPYSKSYI